MLSDKLMGFDRQESKATATGEIQAQAEAQVKAVDDLAERILPLLAPWMRAQAVKRRIDLSPWGKTRSGKSDAYPLYSIPPSRS
jgi:hypothetical protein